MFELMVGLVIVAVLTALAIPYFSTLSQEHQVVGATQQLFYALQYARTAAIKANQTVYVTFNTTDPWCYGANVGSACACRTPSGCSLGTGGASTTGKITFTATGLNSNSLIFEGSRGALSSGNSSILTLTAYGLTTAMSINVSILGNMQMCSNQISGYATCP